MRGGKNFAFKFGHEQAARSSLEDFRRCREARRGRGDAWRLLASAWQSARTCVVRRVRLRGAGAREALAANLLEDFGVAPFLMLTARAEFAFQQGSLGVQAAENGVDVRGVLRVPGGEFLRSEWTMRAARSATNEFGRSGFFAGGEEDFGEDSGGSGSAEGVAG